MWHTDIRQKHKSDSCQVSDVSSLGKVTALGLQAQPKPGFRDRAPTWPLGWGAEPREPCASPHPQGMEKTRTASAHLKYLPVSGSRPSARAQCRLVCAPSQADLMKGEKILQSRHSRKECRTSSELTMPGCTA